MFGFQPVPMSDSYITPAPPGPPINLLSPCEIGIGWVGNGVPDWSASPSNRRYDLRPYISGVAGQYFQPRIWSDTYITPEIRSYPDWSEPHLWIPDSAICNSVSAELITLKIGWPMCTGYDPVTFTLDYCCNNASWITDPATIYGTANNTIQFDLEDYISPVSSHGCTATFYFTPDGSEQSYSQNGSIIQIVYSSAGTYYGSNATAQYGCQCLSAVQMGIVFEVT